jgi:hypothetical protein
LVTYATVDLVFNLNKYKAFCLKVESTLRSILTPFKLLVLRSAQHLPRLAVASSMRRLPKDMCRMVGDMLGPNVVDYSDMF